MTAIAWLVVNKSNKIYRGFYYVKDPIIGECVAEYDDFYDRGNEFIYTKVDADGHSHRIVLHPTHYCEIRQSYQNYPLNNHLRVEWREVQTLNALCSAYNLTYRYYYVRAIGSGEYTYPNNYAPEVRQVRLDDCIAIMDAFLQHHNITIDTFLNTFDLVDDVNKMMRFDDTEISTRQAACTFRVFLTNLDSIIRDGKPRREVLRDIVNRINLIGR